MKETISKSLRIWDECVKSDFISELKKGTLPIEKFKNYMVQDSIYLKHYARVYGKAIFHSTNLRDIQIYYSILSFVTDTESAVRINYLSSFGMTDDDIELIQPLQENQNYIDFLLNIAESGNICEILMAVLPCMMSYSYIFRKIADEPDTSKSQYWDFIQDYADDQYYEDCISWGKFADHKCENLTENEKNRLSKIFEEASTLELDFWKMAYKE
ncbi:transcriptional regulator [Oscillospiraceae bacterium 42-9]